MSEMSMKKEPFGRMPDGRQVYLYTIANSRGVSASFTDLGACWVTMMVPDRDGRMADVVLGYDGAEGYAVNSPNFGAAVGRNANRIAGASYTLNGKEYKLAANNGPNNLHSGPNFYRTRLWEADARADEGRVIFFLQSPDGDQGFPGSADISVSYTLTENDEVRIEYRMICDADTLANFTNHSYFNLAGHDSGPVEGQLVWIDADSFTPVDQFLIPTGELRPVDGTPMDFRERKAIGAEIGADDEQLRLGNGYDHNWVINGWDGSLRLAAGAMDPGSGRAMEVYTDLPGIQLYTSNGLKDTEGKGGARYGFRHAFCFETQYFPNAVNTPSFPSPILRAGDEYRTVTVYKFTAENRRTAFGLSPAGKYWRN